MTFSRDDYPHGLRCMDCDRKLEEGEAIAKRLVAVGEDAVVTETICMRCSLEGALTA